MSKLEILSTDIKFLPGVGPKRAKLLNSELNIIYFEDLLYYFPYKYIDRTKFYKIKDIHPDLPYIQIRGQITGLETVGAKNRLRLIAYFNDGSGIIELVWFKGVKWIRSSLKKGVELVIFGKPSDFNGKINIIHPEIEEWEKRDNSFSYSLYASYNTTEKLKNNFLTSKVILKLQQNLFKAISNNIAETLPANLLNKLNLASLKDALFDIHFPGSPEKLKDARFRLKFEELLFIQLNLLKQKKHRLIHYKGFNFPLVGELFNNFYKQNLKFELTSAQKRVMKEIRKDLGSGKQMNRLLQGDVGSGKTLVAVLSILIALDNKYQTCLMAPTEVLSIQHFNTISKLLKGLGLKISLLTGSTKKAERKIIHEELENGSLDILIGTHALLEDNVIFFNVGIVIIDEQHRFGVGQRARLWKKNINPPHVLIMTATPIPRTLAMTLYGDLDISVIDEMPPGRKPIKTIHFYDSKRLRLFGFLKKELKEGRQVFIVYPLIKESEKMDYKDLEDGYESISRAFPAPQFAVSVVHGKMKTVEKNKAMALFVKGQTQIMVATTVIEVGVDIPNASVMVIESSERFGLSQLHQLRGRVGRGADQSYCILMSSYKLSKEATTRIETMVRTNDGFEIAEVDMKLRGPGDIEGTQQSGLAFDLKIANLAIDGQILQYARDIATDILENDPILEKTENYLLAKKLKDLQKSSIDWSNIS